MKQEITLGVTDRTVLVFIPDPASTDGSGKTGLVAANLTVSYTRVETDNDVVVTDVTSSLNNLSALTDAHNDWGVKEVSSTLAPGLYRLDIADAVFASGAWSAVVYVMITSSAAAASPMEFILVAYNPLDAVRMGLTALPNANADAAGGLPISDAGGLDLDARLDAAVSSRMASYTQPTGFLAATFPSGTVANTTNITAGTITTATNVTTVNGLAANVITTTSINDGAITAAKIAASALNGKGDWNIGKTGYSLTATTGLGNQTADITGSLSGSVGSVTGAINTAAGTITTLDALDTAQDSQHSTTQTAIADLPTNAELATALGTADDAVLAAIAGLNDFDPAADTVARVTLVDTTTTNTDMVTDTAPDVMAIKAKTDSLTFTVAGQVDSNIQYVNDVQVTGDGQTGTEWGPT